MMEKKTAKNTESVLLILIIALAAFLRFYNYAGWSLSNDELSALNRLRYDSFGEMIRQGVMLGDFHPAGVQVFLYVLTGLFGNSVWVVRLPFVLFGIVSVYLVYLIGKRWFGVPTGLYAAAAMAFLQYPILYSQLARPYSPGLLFSLATVWFWTKIVFAQKKKIPDYVWFMIFATLTAYTHHYSFLFVLIVGISGLFFYRKLNLKYYLLSGLAVGLLYLPHLGIFLHQFGIGGIGGAEGWLAAPEPHWIIGYLKYAFNGSWLTVTIFIILFLGTFIFWFPRKITNFHCLSVSWFLVSFFIGYFYSIWRNPILQFSILLFSFPFLILFLFSFMGKNPDKWKVGILLAFLIFGTIQTVFINKFYKCQHFGEFKDVALKISQWNQKYGAENITNAIVVNGPFYIHYYLDEDYPGLKFAQYDNTGGNELLKLKKIVDAAQTPYFIHAWTKPCPNEIPDIIKTKYPCVLGEEKYTDVYFKTILSEVTLFAREISDSCLTTPKPLIVFEQTFETEDLWGGKPEQLDSSKFVFGKFSYKLDKTVEYGPAFTKKISEINGGNFNKIHIALWAFAPEPISNMPIVISIENAEKGGYIWASSHIENFIFQDEWGRAFFNFDMPEVKSKDDVLKIYVWNVERKNLFIDDFSIEFLKIIPCP